MKVSILFMVSMLFSASLFAKVYTAVEDDTAKLSAEMKAKANVILTEMDKNNILAADRMSFSTLVYLKSWPKVVIEALNTFLSEERGFFSKDEFVTRYSYSDPSGEYTTDSWIFRSLELSAGDERAYLAIYDTEGGEWGREECFRTFFLQDIDGKVGLRGSLSFPYCEDEY